MSGHAVRRGGLALEHVAIELGRPAHRLAGVVDDEVEAVPRLVQVLAEGLDARRVPQVEAEDLEPVAPLAEVGLPRVARGRVAREAGRHDQVGAGTQQLDAGLVADLHAPARQQGDAPREVCGLGALAVVEVAALRAQLVVERVDLDVVALAHVAVLRLDDLAEAGIVLDVLLLEGGGREHVRRGEDGLLPQHADAGLGEHGLVALELRCLRPAPRRLARLPPARHVRLVRGRRPR